MDSSPLSPDEESFIFLSPENSAETVRSEKIRTSVSVSSLAEKFEKGGDSVKSEGIDSTGDEVSESQKEIKQSPIVSSLQDKSVTSEIDSVQREIIATEDTSQPLLETNDATNSCQKEVNADQIKGIVNNANNIVQYSKIIDEVNSAVKDLIESCDFMQLSSTDNEANETNFTVTQVSNAVEERVAYFAEKISKSLPNSATSISPKKKSGSSPNFSGEAGKVLVSREQDTKYREIVSQISVKDLEQSFVEALKLANTAEAKNTADTAAVPSIKITEASDQEETSSEIAEETVSELEADETKTKLVEKSEESDVQNVEDPTPSSSADVQFDKKDESEVCTEERKAFFYISSSDLPEQPSNEPTDNSEELQQQEQSLEESTESGRSLHSNRKKDSYCLCSKSFHGAVFLASVLIAVLGFILYSLAHEGKVPDFCEPLGLITTITAGIVGAFSCFCFSFLEAFPRVPVTDYERLVDTEIIPPANIMSNIQKLVNESLSSETELASRVQNGEPSTRSSESSIRSRHSDHKELIEKVDKIKKEVIGLLDSFTEMMMILKPVDELLEMESGEANVKLTNDDVKTSNEVLTAH